MTDEERAWREAVKELDDIERAMGIDPTPVTPIPFRPNPSRNLSETPKSSVPHKFRAGALMMCSAILMLSAALHNNISLLFLSAGFLGLPAIMAMDMNQPGTSSGGPR